MRRIVDRPFDGEKNYIEAAGKSTEMKPTTGIVTGSLYMESDTGDCYVFDETDVTWTKIGG